MVNDPLPVDLVRSTISSLEDHRARLERERQEVLSRIEQVDKDLSRWRTVLTKQEGQKQPKKRPRGENERLIRELFRDNPGAAYTQKQIADVIGVKPSSVQAVLSKKAEAMGLGQDEDDRWHKKTG